MFHEVLLDCFCFNFKDETVLQYRYKSKKRLNITENERLTIRKIIRQYITSMLNEFERRTTWPTLTLPSHRYMAGGSPFTVYFVSVIAEGSRKVVMLIRKMDSTVPEYMKKQPPFGVNICWDICLWRVVIPRIEKFSERVA